MAPSTVTPDMFAGDEPQESLLAMSERLDAIARSLIEETAKFRARLATETKPYATAAPQSEHKRHVIKDVLTYFDARHQARFDGTPAKIDGAKDSMIVKRLLGTYGEDKVRELIDLFFEDDSEFVQRAGYSVGIFSSRVSGLISSSMAVTRLAGVTPRTSNNGQNARAAGDLIRRSYGGHATR